MHSIFTMTTENRIVLTDLLDTNLILLFIDRKINVNVVIEMIKLVKCIFIHLLISCARYIKYKRYAIINWWKRIEYSLIWHNSPIPYLIWIHDKNQLISQSNVLLLLLMKYFLVQPKLYDLFMPFVIFILNKFMICWREQIF